MTVLAQYFSTDLMVHTCLILLQIKKNSLLTKTIEITLSISFLHINTLNIWLYAKIIFKLMKPTSYYQVGLSI